MCGIIGILGAREVAPLLVDALGRLEYRGYDSAGIATIDDAGRLGRRRATGKLANLARLVAAEPLSGRAGIGHTRWATHGAPSVENAHPHVAGPVAVVHNGIIENFRALQTDLAGEGYTPRTQTDTEVIALLCRRFLDRGLAPREAARATIARLEGAFALCLLFEGEGDLLIAARQGAPLALARHAGEAFVGSDAIALAPLADRIVYLDDGDRAEITREGVTIFDSAGRIANRAEHAIAAGAARADRAGYRHFMAKEIDEQPSLLAEMIARHAGTAGDEIALPGPPLPFATCERVSLVACGTAFYACLAAKYWFEELAGLPAEVDVASEFRYREPPVPGGTLAFLVSQSGETADTLAALRYLNGRAARTVAVVNVAESSIARESDQVLALHAGAEIGVASTKAFTAQLTLLLLLALEAARARGRLSSGELGERLAQLRALPGLVHRALGSGPAIARIAKGIARARDVLFIGRGVLYPLALEGALKLKEISYIHAEGYAAGELKHGPIALVDDRTPVVALAPGGRLFGKMASNIEEVMARGGKVVLITDPAGAAGIKGEDGDRIVLPEAPEFLAPVLHAVAVQLLAYHTALARGTDVDQPRNLAKSVTVE